jgi:hypothetical protein
VIRSWRFPFDLLVMLFGTCMPSVTSMMHKEMHEGAGEERQPDEHTEDMGSVLGEQKRARDDGKSYEYQPCS